VDGVIKNVFPVPQENQCVTTVESVLGYYTSIELIELADLVSFKATEPMRLVGEVKRIIFSGSRPQILGDRETAVRAGNITRPSKKDFFPKPRRKVPHGRDPKPPPGHF
jgi:hypothetical protein